MRNAMSIFQLSKCRLDTPSRMVKLPYLYLSAEIHPQPEQDEIGALEFLLTWYDIAGKIDLQ